MEKCIVSRGGEGETEDLGRRRGGGPFLLRTPLKHHWHNSLLATRVPACAGAEQMTFEINPLGGPNRRLLQDAFTSVAASLRPLVGQEATLALELQGLERSRFRPLVSALQEDGRPWSWKGAGAGEVWGGALCPQGVWRAGFGCCGRLCKDLGGCRFEGWCKGVRASCENVVS